MEDVAGALAVFVLPFAALAWPVVTLIVVRNHPSWGAWGLAGCVLFALVMIPLGTLVMGEARSSDMAMLWLLLGGPMWLVGTFNAVVAGVGVRSVLRRPWVMPPVVAAVIAILSWLAWRW